MHKIIDLMNKLLICCLVIITSALSTSAQVFPFYDDYESYGGFNVPPGYSGNVTVYLAHGTSSSKALTPFLTSFSTKDSIIFPLIGPVAPNSALFFDWRIVEPTLYPSTPANYTAGDNFEFLASVDGINYQTIFSVNSTNYTNSTSFANAFVPLPSYVGGNLYLKVRGTRVTGSGEFFIDIDNVVVDAVSSVQEKNNSTFSVFPSPSTGGFNFTNATPMSGTLRVLDQTGKIIIERQLINELQGHVELSKVSAGNYHVQIITDSGIKISDLIVR